MKTYLPNYFKQIGILFVLIAIAFSLIGGIDRERQGFAEGQLVAAKQMGGNVEQLEEQLKRIEEEPILSEEKSELYIMISLFFSITGLLLYLFSKEKIDDEYIQQIRLKSILQAFMISWIVYAFAKCIIEIHPMDGIYILQMQLLIYVTVFRHNKNKELLEEEEAKIALEDKQV